MKKVLVGLLLVGLVSSAFAVRMHAYTNHYAHNSVRSGSGAQFTVQSGDTCQSIATAISKHCSTILYIGAVGGNQPWCVWQGSWIAKVTLQAGATGQYNCQ